jgi:hypothetical protein
MAPSGTRRLRAGAASAAVAVCVLVCATPAAARDLTGVPANLGEQAASAAFVVHYTTQPGDPNAITPEAAQQLLATAERVLGDSIDRLGMPRPLDDGDGRADVYVFQTLDDVERGMVRADSRADQTTGWIAIPPDATGDTVAVAHQIVHLQQLAIYRPAGSVLAEGTATWAPLHLYSAELGRLSDQAQFFPDDPLDCTDDDACGRPGYGSWQFFELLAERHGAKIVRAIYDRSRALGDTDHRPHFLDALQDVLLARSTTLPATFAGFTAANLVGDYALPGLARSRYGATEPFDDLATGTRPRRLRARAVTLDHLAAAFYRLRSGSDVVRAGRARCGSARLRIAIIGPAGLEAPLYYAPFRPRRGAARAIPLVDGRATVEVPWSTCRGRELGIALHNPSPAVDGRTFTLRVRVVARRASRR